MKKRSRKEKKEAFKKAYYAEMQKQGLMETQAKELTKAELVKKAKELGIEIKSNMTKVKIVELIEASNA